MKKQTHLNLGWPEGKYFFSKYAYCDTYIDEISIISIYHAALFWMIFKTLPLLLSPLVWTGLKTLHCCSLSQHCSSCFIDVFTRTKGTGWGSSNRSWHSCMPRTIPIAQGVMMPSLFVFQWCHLITTEKKEGRLTLFFTGVAFKINPLQSCCGIYNT